MSDLQPRSKYTFHNTTETYPGHLSPSSIIEWLRCSECFRLNRVEHLPRPLGINLAIGSSVHKAIEQARLGVAQNGEAKQIAADWFDLQCAAPADPDDGTPLAEIDLGSSYSSLGQAKDHAVALTEFAVPALLKLDAKRGKLAAVEHNLLEIPAQPYPFRVEGRLDCLYVDWLGDPEHPELAVTMADLKTSRTQSPPDEYTAIAQAIYREWWSSRGLDLTVLVDVISKTKAPDLQTYSLAVDDYAAEFVHRTVLQVAEDISAGRFRPRPNWSCSYTHGGPEFSITVPESDWRVKQ